MMNESQLSTHLVAGDDDVYPLGYEPMAKDPTNSQERESSANSSKEEEGEEEEKEREDEVASLLG